MKETCEVLGGRHLPRPISTYTAGIANREAAITIVTQCCVAAVAWQVLLKCRISLCRQTVEGATGSGPPFHS